MCVGLTIYALKTKSDFTLMGGIIWVLISVSLFLCITQFFIRSPLINLIYNLIGVTLASLYILYDVQLIFQGKHQRALKLSQEDYVRGSLMLYLDVMYLFLELLKLLGQSDRR